ncbi:MAG: matrixin family metalloprotease, partial [Blastocatellia bacterium]
MKKSLLLLFVLIAITSFAPRAGKGYVRSPLGSNGMGIAWNLADPGTPKVVGGRITYNLNPAGSDNLPFSQVEQTIAASFQTWENIPTSTVAFSRGPNTSATATANDDVLQIYWLENSTTTSDGLNLAGALAVSRLTTFSSGPRSGEIIDAALVFNGNQFTWAVDGRASAADLAEVATHEIGHVIGISHTGIGGATMFPRSGLGRTRGRTLEMDDTIAASVIYPAPGFAAATGVIQGRVSDGGGAGIFGAQVVVVDSNGNATSGALSQPDGGYSVQGLPPGNYTVYAEPTDPAGGVYFSKADLTGFYNGIVTDFSTSQDFQVAVAAGQQTGRDITVARGAPALDAYIVYDAPNVSFVNAPTIVAQGQINVTVGAAGPGLPQSGSPLSISGPGITILRQYFRTTSNGLPAVLADISVSPTAPPGARNLIISNGSQRTIMTGAIELATGSGTGSSLAVVSSANFAAAVAAESIASVFGTGLATTTQASNSNPLPTSLAGTSILLRDAQGNERLAPLFFVSPAQIN